MDKKQTNTIDLDENKMNSVKLGIAVVYFYSENDLWILKLHLNEIKTNTTENYTIYAAANRLSEKYKDILENTSNLEIVELPNITETGAKEHGKYLDSLLRYAINDGCTHLCTLDCDSWPTQMGWDNTLINLMSSNNVELAAVLRTELGDKWLPHPCGLMIKKEFIKKYDPKMWPKLGTKDFQLFIDKTQQRLDTGIGFGYILWKYNLEWLKLERINIINEHYLMAGIYENGIFHLGATSRLKIFYKEFNNTWARKTTSFLTKVPILWRYKQKIEYKLLNIFPPRINFNNLKISNKINKHLQDNPKIFYKKLLGLI